MNAKLSALPETLLIPLWARAKETARPDSIIQDVHAAEILKALDFDFHKFEKAWMSQVGIAVRTELLDRAALAFIERHPEATVINLGAGLDARFLRLDNGKIGWHDLDLPEVIELRKRYFRESDRWRFIATSIFDPSWTDEFRECDARVLLIAEGLLMYFEEKEVKALFERIAKNFPGGEMLVDMLGPWLVGKSRFQDAVSKIRGVEFKWSLAKSRDFEGWSPKIKFVEEWYYTDYHRDRWGWFGKMNRPPFLKQRLANRIVHLRFNP